mgnify:CR=1 FL=1
MNNDIQIFNYNNREVRTVQKDGEPWFVLKDVCAILDISNHKMTAQRLDVDEVSQTYLIDSIGRKQEMTVINESGLYNVILRSDKPEAKPFRKWVTSEVLPSIRKHGAYMTQEKLQEVLCNPDALFQIVSALKEESDKRKALEIQNSALAVDLAIAQPKADYFDDCMARGGLMNFRDTAKLLGMRQKEFIDNLLRDSYLYRDKRGRLLPYQKRNNGYLEIKEAFNNSSDWNGVQTLVTPKGREFFRSLYPSV